MDHNQISLALDVESFIPPFELKIGKSKEKSFFEIIRCTFKRQVNHIDFQRVDEKESTLMFPCILLEENSPAVKMAGINISYPKRC